mmetsp:Transcript_55654/g.155108  ORF Transcript_55654/g.155108 Transcript_55654/m.155108 type:complete len:242 (-) Transcript_55654:718-1443(-)
MTTMKTTVVSKSNSVMTLSFNNPDSTNLRITHHIHNCSTLWRLSSTKLVQWPAVCKPYRFRMILSKQYLWPTWMWQSAPRIKLVWKRTCLRTSRAGRSPMVNLCPDSFPLLFFFTKRFVIVLWNAVVFCFWIELRAWTAWWCLDATRCMMIRPSKSCQMSSAAMESHVIIRRAESHSAIAASSVSKGTSQRSQLNGDLALKLPRHVLYSTGTAAYNTQMPSMYHGVAMLSLGASSSTKCLW